MFGVFGLGKAGRAAVAALLAGGAAVYADDDKPLNLDVAPLPNPPPKGGGDQDGIRNPQLATRNYRQWPWEELSALVLSPGVPLAHPVVTMACAAGCPVMGEIELLQRALPDALKIGITGTNGKSTTTALIGHILTEAGRHPRVGGNLGTPALALSGNPGEPDSPFVLEMSSFQLDLMLTVRFDVAVWLNITPDHLDRHGDMEGYIAAKRHIFERQRAGDAAVIGIDDAYSEAVARELGDRAVTIHVHHASSPNPPLQGGRASAHIEVKDGLLLDRRDGTRVNLRDCKGLKGEHNWQNAAAAYAACRHLGVASEIISEAMRSFGGLAHRMEWVMQKGGVIYVNDSKATNADATAKALAAYPENIYWILGGRPKAGGITGLGAFFPRIKHAYLLGEAEAEFAATLEGHVPYTRCGTLEAATRAAGADAVAAGKGVVLLSPACASWDQWPNFEVRGEAFKEYVKAFVHRVEDMA